MRQSGAELSRNGSQARMRVHKQFGDDYVLIGGPSLPWRVSGLREMMDRFHAESLTVFHRMLPPLTMIISGREGRENEIQKVTYNAATDTQKPRIAHQRSLRHADFFVAGEV